MGGGVQGHHLVVGGAGAGVGPGEEADQAEGGEPAHHPGKGEVLARSDGGELAGTAALFTVEGAYFNAHLEVHPQIGDLLGLVGHLG